jgi:alkyl hydroperoxide reductase subunit AhpC
LAGFEKFKSELDGLGIKIVAASIDPLDKAKEAAATVSFPVGYGVTRAMADQLGSWWEERRSIIQPSEFLVAADGKVRASTYSSGPIGRVDPADVVRLVNFYDKQAAEKK